MSSSWFDDDKFMLELELKRQLVQENKISVPFEGELGYMTSTKLKAFEVQQLLVDAGGEGIVDTQIIDLGHDTYVVIGSFDRISRPIKVNGNIVKSGAATRPCYMISLIPGYQVPREIKQLCDYVVEAEHVKHEIDLNVSLYSPCARMVVENRVTLKITKNRFEYSTMREVLREWYDLNDRYTARHTILEMCRLQVKAYSLPVSALNNYQLSIPSITTIKTIA